MRSAVLDHTAFSIAERSALRLDGECVALGLSHVPVGTPVRAADRAASLAAATARYDLVVELRTAAWVHGAVPDPPDPLTLAIDRGSRRGPKLHVPTPREVRFVRTDLQRLGGVLVTTPLRTAFDLVRLEGGSEAEEVAAALLRDARIAPPIAAALAQLCAASTGKQPAIDRLATLPARPTVAPGQFADTR